MAASAGGTFTVNKIRCDLMESGALLPLDDLVLALQLLHDNFDGTLGPSRLQGYTSQWAIIRAPNQEIKAKWLALSDEEHSLAGSGMEDGSAFVCSKRGDDIIAVWSLEMSASVSKCRSVHAHVNYNVSANERA